MSAAVDVNIIFHEVEAEIGRIKNRIVADSKQDAENMLKHMKIAS